MLKHASVGEYSISDTSVEMLDFLSGSVSEWLRSLTRNQIGSACVGSNPTAVVFDFRKYFSASLVRNIGQPNITCVLDHFCPFPMHLALLPQYNKFQDMFRCPPA